MACYLINLCRTSLLFKERGGFVWQFYSILLMRILLFFIYFLGGLLMAGMPAVAQELYPMRNFNKWGYINSEGRWIIPPKYEMALNFSDGLALVKDTYKGGEVWDVINEKGQKVIQSEYYGYGIFLKIYDYRISFQPNQQFTEGLIPVAIEIMDPHYKGEAVSGFLNKEGELEVYGYYDKVYNFHNGYAAAVKDGKFGFIDKTGDWVISPTYVMAGSFSNGLAPALDEKSRKWGYINKEGAWVVKPQFSKAKDFSDGLAAVWKDFKWGYINVYGEYIVPLQYRIAESFSDGYAYVGKDNTYYFIDKNGQKAFSEDLYQKLCFTKSFENGAALMAIAPEGRNCFNFELSEDVILQDTNLLLYVDTNGDIIYKQELEEYYTVNKIRRP